MPKLASYRECTGCMACVDSCGHQAIRSVLNQEGHLVPFVDSKICVDCKLCEKSCPIISNLAYATSESCDAYAAWSKDLNIRKKSATAGAFASMAQYTLSLGGVVCGAAIVEGIYVRHILIDRQEDINKLQGSKYTQSDTTGIFRSVYLNLKEGKLVLFSGTGCQVAGLLGYLESRKYRGKLITVDLICGGVPSRFLIDKFVEGEPYKVKKIISFRTKDNGWSPKGFRYNLKVEDDEGKIHDYTGIRNLITYGFACEMTNRYSCYNCKFSGIHRMSDFTIGDYWGIKEYSDQHRDGVSVIITHNRNASNFLSEMYSFLEYHNADINDVISHNKRLIQGKDNRAKMLERRYLSFFFRHLSYKILCRIYALEFSNKSPWILYKGIRTIVSKIIR